MEPNTFKDFEGLIVPVFTPRNSDSDATINTKIIPQYSEYLKSKGVKAILINGTVAEAMTMTVSERKELAEAWSAAAKENEQRLIIQVGGACIMDVKELAKHAESLNADAILCLPELYYRTINVYETIDYFKEIAGAAPKTPLLYYHNPRRSNVVLAMRPFLEEAGKKIPTLVGMKVVGSDFEEGFELNNERFTSVLTTEKIIPSGYLSGFRKYMVISANLFPEVVLRIISYCEARHYAEAQSLQRLLNQRVNEIASVVGPGFAAMKAVMSLLTPIDVGPMRSPLRTFEADLKFLPICQEKIDL